MTGFGLACSKGPARHRAGLLFLCAALLAAAPARAAAFELSATAGLRHVRYEERGPYGDLLDSEDGWIPSVGARARLRAGRLVGELSGRIAWGDVTYHGLVQGSGGGGWMHGTSAARFLEGGARAGAIVDPWRRLTLLAGFGARRWDRDIHGTTLATGGATTPVRGLSEDYSWYELDATARAALVETPRVAWLAELRVFQILSPHLSVAWNGTDVGIDLGRRAGFGAGTEVQVTLRPGLFLSAGASVERLRFGASDAVPVGRTWLSEPRSDTWNVRVEGGIGVRL